MHSVANKISKTIGLIARLRHISCGHTTDFYLGKSNLPRVNSSIISRGKFISGFVWPSWKFWEGHTTDIGSQGFHGSWMFWSVNLKRQDALGSSWSKRRFFLYLAVISYANSRCKVKKAEDVRGRHVPPKFLSQRELCPVLSSRPSPMSVDWLTTSVFHFSLAIALG